MAVKLGGAKDYSAMQGPAPDGFHVPLNTERQAVKDIRTALGGGSSDGPNFGIALKLPMAGYRNSSSSNVTYQGSDGDYWSSSRYDTDRAYSLHFYSSSIYPQNANRRSYGFSVRCFKNTPVIPTSSWTKLYGTSIEAGGVFWNATDGLISLSGDGTTWITIADKNLGATQVWNSGDTLSEANCGKYYQWGNNYGFPRTGTIANQSTTQVDASTYGPGNYYSSDTFIKYSGRWDTTDNGNLWGGVTGIRLGDLYKAYIGEYTGRLPSAYQEVERIGTSGSQWINTGFVISGVTGIQTETKIAVNTTSQNIPIFGSYSPNYNSSTPTSGKYYHLTPYSNKWYFGKNGSEGNGGSYSATVGKQYEIVYNNSSNYLNVDGSNVVSVSGTTGPTSPYTYTIAISRRGTARSGDAFYGSWNYYYFNIYNRNTSTYERQMIPCYRKSDNVIGMYDLVTNTFYTNNGTGTFTKGNDVD